MGSQLPEGEPDLPKLEKSQLRYNCPDLLIFKTKILNQDSILIPTATSTSGHNSFP